MYRHINSSAKLVNRKRRSSVSTPPITQFFNSIKRERSLTESKNNVSQKLEDSPGATPNNSHIPEKTEKNSDEELRNLLGVRPETRQQYLPNSQMPASLENLPNNVYSYIFTILDLNSVSALALTSNVMAFHVKSYVADYQFYRRMQMDHLDFVNSSIRPDDEEFQENDPFTACGALIKSITITLDTKIRAQVFLNICRNLRHQLGGSLHGFGRLLETVTKYWKFSERRVMIKAAILIDQDLRNCLIQALTSTPGQYVGLEMKVRSGLTELFLNRNQEIDDSRPDEIIEFGSWLSILLRNVVEKYQGRLYYILFGPTKASRIGERIDWVYFCVDKSPQSIRKSDSNFKRILTTLLSGIRALNIMNNAEASDMAWRGRKIYQLFLRVVESCEELFPWSEKSSSMALAIDPSCLFTEYLVNCLDPSRPDYSSLMTEAAEMVCLVRGHLYRWTANPSTYLAEPLHHAFNHLAQLDGHYGGSYKTFFDKIWRTQQRRLSDLVAGARNTAEFNMLIKDELDGQLATVRLFSDISDAIMLQQQGLQLPDDLPVHVLREVLEQDEQEE